MNKMSTLKVEGISRFSQVYQTSKFTLTGKRESIFSSVISVLQDSKTKKEMSIFIQEA